MLQNFFDNSSFMPHGHCFLWQPNILWLHLISDLVIAAAYFSLPLALIYFARKRPDMPFRHILVLFGLFIALCGTTHLFGIWVLWHPDYGPEGLVKAATGIVSATTAILIWLLMPKLLMLPSPKQLQTINEELKITKDEVEEKVVLRTLELEEANRRLQDVSNAAEKASQAKSEFLANMSHEIRTPMNAVVGLAHILTMTNLDDKQRKFIETLQLSADSLLSLINDLLDITKIESDFITLELHDFNMIALLKEVIAILSLKAKEKGLSLTCDIDERFNGYVVGDSTRARQIFINLINNAIKFTQTGGVAIRVDLVGPEENRKIHIAVRDTGIGIAPEKQEMVFSKFLQADTSITRRYGGSGLGLAIAKRLAMLMGGTITLESEENIGSCFTFIIPYLPAAVPQTLAPAYNARRIEKAIAAKQRILLVEDYEPNITVAATLLEHLGFRIDIARNGQEALDMAAHRKYDLILMDLQMPVLDGYSATRRIRAREKASGSAPVPIIGVTAHVLLSDKQKCIDAGLNDFIAKPYTAAMLENKILAYIAD